MASSITAGTAPCGFKQMHVCLGGGYVKRAIARAHEWRQRLTRHPGVEHNRDYNLIQEPGVGVEGTVVRIAQKS